MPYLYANEMSCQYTSRILINRWEVYCNEEKLIGMNSVTGIMIRVFEFDYHISVLWLSNAMS